PEVYRGLFKLYRAEGRSAELTDLIDRAWGPPAEGEEPDAEARRAAADRARAMLAALEEEPGLVEELMEAAVREVYQRRRRQSDTWQLMATLADRTGQLGRAEVLFREALRGVGPRSEAAVYDGLLRVLWRANKPAAVAALCREALEGRPRATNLVLFHTHLAMALAELGQFGEALAQADRAVELSGDGTRLAMRCRKVHVLRRAGRFADAVAECERMLKEYAEPHEVREVRYALATVYSAARQYARAEEQLRLILDIDPNDATANNDLGYHWADRGVNLAEAERLIRRAIELDRAQRRSAPDGEPDNAAFLDSLGWVLFRKGDAAGAREWLEKAAALPEGRDDPVVWDHLGDVYARLGEPARAAAAWRKALELFGQKRRENTEGRAEEIRRKLGELPPGRGQQ
ncbi:MAG TPA: tetratricopeptide repeat protein, partial [Gemmataceae bacterium]